MRMRAVRLVHPDGIVRVWEDDAQADLATMPFELRVTADPEYFYGRVCFKTSFVLPVIDVFILIGIAFACEPVGHFVRPPPVEIVFCLERLNQNPPATFQVLHQDSVEPLLAVFASKLATFLDMHVVLGFRRTAAFRLSR